MGYQHCLTAIQAAAGGRLTDDDLEEILDGIVKLKRKKLGETPLKGDEEATIAAARELTEEERLTALVEKRSRAINVLRKQQRFAAFDARPGEAAETLRAMNVGSEATFAGSARSVDAERNGIMRGLTGPLLAELRQGGLLQLLKRRTAAFDRDVAREMWRAAGGGGDATGNRAAEAAAAIFVKYEDMARVLQNEAGAWIRKMPGWILRQNHDQFRIVRAGFADWRDWIVPRLDPATFDGIDDVDGWLKAVWTNLATGNHLKSSGANADDWLMKGFTGPGNLAKKLGRPRKLHFRDADAWYEYNERFGSSSLLEGVFGGLQAASRNTALMRVWGTNPEAAFLKDVEQLTMRAKAAGNLDEVGRLSNWLTSAEFDQVSGAASIPGNPRLAEIAQTVRNVMSMAKLGGVVLASIPDIVVRASSLRHNGVNFLEAVGDGFASIVRGRGAGETREIADYVGVGIDGMLGGILGRFSATDNVPGKMSKLMDTFFRANLLTWWTDAQATGVGLMLSRNLARHRAKAFAELDEGLQGNLIRYGIGADGWDLIRARQVKAADGREYVTPDMVEQISDDEIRAWLKQPDADANSVDPRAIERARRDLTIGLQTYFVDQTAEAMTVAGARQRAIATLGSRAGTPLGEAVRFMMQFKTYGITFVSRHVMREVRRRGQVDGFGLAQLILATTAMGYVSQSAKELVKGRTPRDPTKIGTWLAAMQQGGGLGIYGDFLFGEYNRFGGGLIETLAGPTAGTAGDLARVWAAAIRGEDAGATGVKAVMGAAPFANLFYTRMALDYALLYHVQEWMNPGYLRRMEKRVARDNGQQFIVNPSRVIERGGGFQ